MVEVLEGQAKFCMDLADLKSWEIEIHTNVWEGHAKLDFYKDHAIFDVHKHHWVHNMGNKLEVNETVGFVMVQMTCMRLT